MELIEKPIYTLSASLLNNIKWYKSQRGNDLEEKQAKALEQLKSSLRKEKIDSPHFKAGNDFEDEVLAGKHPDMYLDLENSEPQKWFNRFIEYADFRIKLVAKFDLVNEEEIFDIKYTSNFYADKYSDESTIQHDLYLYMKPDAKRFWYNIGYKDKAGIMRYIALPVERKENLEQYILEHIEEFFKFLNTHNLLELYLENYKVDF